jgi:hypothetical protein
VKAVATRTDGSHSRGVHDRTESSGRRVPAGADGAVILLATLCAMLLCGAVLNVVAQSQRAVTLLAGLFAVLLICALALAVAHRLLRGW